MPVEFPYAQVVGKIPLLLQTVGEKGIPSKVDQKWLAQFGMGSSNDRRLVSLLRFLGFTDAHNVPTEVWRNYRGANSRAVLGEAIRSAYSELFHAYPQAQDATVNELTTFFRTRTTSGQDVVTKTTSTFRTLVGLADFSSSENWNDNSGSDIDENGNGSQPERIDQRTPATAVQRTSQPPVIINVNLQLTLPASEDPAVYDALFESLSKHVLSSGNDIDA